jgi:hypothetical protein
MIHDTTTLITGGIGLEMARLLAWNSCWAAGYPLIESATGSSPSLACRDGACHRTWDRSRTVIGSGAVEPSMGGRFT